MTPNRLAIYILLGLVTFSVAFYLLCAVVLAYEWAQILFGVLCIASVLYGTAYGIAESFIKFNEEEQRKWDELSEQLRAEGVRDTLLMLGLDIEEAKK